MNDECYCDGMEYANQTCDKCLKEEQQAFAAMRKERDEARVEVARLLSYAEIARLENIELSAEVARMKPVVEAALLNCQINPERTIYALVEALDTYREATNER